MAAIAPLTPADRGEWDALARGYKAFYEDPQPDSVYERTWTRLMAGHGIRGLGARLDGRLAGIAHYMFHPNSWTADVCYLRDLFTAPDARGRGVARALIDAVADAARAHGCAKYYWLTRDSNETARALYDKVARFKGFVRYDYPL
jgi:GNAT superfamily N-acetyltransferase